MSIDHGLVIQLYWGGRIVENGGSISYDPPRCNKIILVKQHTSFDDLVDRVYKAMQLERDAVKISLLLRSLVGVSSYTGVPIVDDDDVNSLYYIKADSPHTPCEIYVEVEERPSVDLCGSGLAEPSYAPYVTDGLHSVPILSVGYDSQLTQCEPALLPSNRPIRRRRTDCRATDQPSSSQMVEDTPASSGHSTDNHGYSTPVIIGDQLGVDADIDSEPESASEDLGIENIKHNTADPHPGPHDTSLLVLQHQHRSRTVYFGTEKQLKAKRCDGHFWDLVKEMDDTRILHYLDLAGFSGVIRTGHLTYDQALITALIERWHQETHTFHLPWGEATVTLQDVAVLWGLRVDGLPVTLVDRDRDRDQKKALIHELLGFYPDNDCFKEGRLNIASLFPHVHHRLPKNAPDELVRQRARMYILMLLTGQLFADTCGNLVSLHWLDYIRDLEGMAQYSWGSAVLAALYRSMCRACQALASSTAGPYMLLQLWAWERMPTIRPNIVIPLPQGHYPRGARWTTTHTGVNAPQHSLPYHRDQLSKLGQNDFIWEPYTADVLASIPSICTVDSHIWRARVPLIYWHIVEVYLPNRVLRQFGIAQDIPEPPDTHARLHSLGRSGRSGMNWAEYHSSWVHKWNTRTESVIDGPPADPYSLSLHYMRWYQLHTVRYITPPVIRQPQRDGLRGDAGQHDYLMDTIARIGWVSHACLTEDASQQQNMQTQLEFIRDEAFGSMQYLGRDFRMTLGTFDRQDAGSSTQTNVPREVLVQHVHRQGQRQSRRGRRRQRVQLPVDDDDDDDADIPRTDVASTSTPAADA